MAAKLLHSLTDENPDLQKQIGCMTGIFQLFDRQHILTSGNRRLVGHTPKRLPSGNSHFHSLDRDSNNKTYGRSASTEKYSTPLKPTQERQRISTESSRASFSSSSRSSSFSSLDCNRAPHLDPAPFDRIIFPETPSQDPAMSLQNSSPQSTRQNLDIRDLVKDSMYREIHAISLKPKDSPRPQPRTSSDLKESLKTLSKLQESPWYQNEPPRELLRSASYHAKEGTTSFSICRDAPRFSYDGREVNRAPLDFSKSGPKLRDAPRLSLDSRDSKSSVFLRSSVEIIPQQVAVGNQSRPPSVVAKLMGLEALPDSVTSSNDSNSVVGQSFSDEDFFDIPWLSAKKGQKSVQTSSSLRKKEPSMKPISRFPIEPAPWKQIDGAKSSQKAVRAPPKASTAFPSVYSEIEKRLQHLEFTQSGKDLRALKQILEAMQSKGFLENEKETQAQGLNEQKHSSSVSNKQKQWAGPPRKHYESPIVIMKPAKLVEKSSVPSSSVIPLNSLPSLTKPNTESVDNNTKGLSSGRKSGQQANAVNSVNMMRNERTLKNTQTSSRVSSQLGRDGNVGTGKSTGTGTGSISPRMQLKKIEMEKRSRPPTPPDSGKSRRQPNKQQGDSSNSPGGRRRLKLTGVQLLSVDQPREANVDSSRYFENETLIQSHESITQRSSAASSCENLSVNASKFVLSDLVEKKSTNEAESRDFGFVPPEYSSPVSVLDKVVCKDDSPSPVSYVGKTLKVDDAPTEKNSDDRTTGQENPLDGPHQTQAQINRKKLQNIETLVQKLRRLNSTHDEARTDYIASLCEQTTNPDHRYISEILLASGLLLRELGSSLVNFQFHPSGHPINPELFLVLEQTKTSALSGGRPQRKLIFDAVNEILTRKLAGPGSRPWACWAGNTGLTAQRLLGDLCSEMDRLRARNGKCGVGEEDEKEGWKELLHEDVKNESGEWRDCERDVSGAVLDIERSIFKDLVNEVVIGELIGLRGKPGRRRLFVK
ncbi:protein LONGIFOLIA 1 [Striga asiatica]|uniref:Protein LONGIFOLIA 1 n=1 Tax=Striga asiatica TaxID=4170 RepID=A0A5A7Q4N5_STRAF|nr:protein LONGIFOLIA 1 [Striga asiatica]